MYVDKDTHTGPLDLYKRFEPSLSDVPGVRDGEYRIMAIQDIMNVDNSAPYISPRSTEGPYSYVGYSPSVPSAVGEMVYLYQNWSS